MLHSSTVLALRLPALPVNHYYQLALVGAFQLRVHSTHQRAVSLYFRVKGPAKEYQEPIGDTVHRRVNLNEALALIAGSLWAAPGRMVSTGQTLHIPSPEGESPRPPIAILNKVHRFSIGSAIPQVMTLADAFPDLTRLGSKLLRTQPNIWVLVHEEAGRRFIVPCFELLRTFYYVDGRHLLDFYFSLTDLSSICVPRVWPTVANGYTAHVDVVSDQFTTHQIRVLAQLCFDSFFRKAVIKAHSDLLLGPLRSTDGAHVRLNFHLGRDIWLDANGFEFSYDNTPCFWVCSILAHEPFWNFQHLTCTAAIDHRSAPKTASQDIVEPRNGGGRPRLDVSRTPTIDSDRAGASHYTSESIELNIELQTTLPSVEWTPKSTQDTRSPTTYSFFTALPTYLSSEGGGKDLDTARIASIQPRRIPLSLSQFFRDLVQWFKNQTDFGATFLLVNNADQRHGSDLSVFPYWWNPPVPAFLNDGKPRAVGIAHLTHGTGNFYLLQVLEGGRAALVFKQNQQILTNTEINNVLAALAEVNFNWVRLNQANASLRQLAQRLGTGLIIEPRNHADANKAASICATNIRQTYLKGRK